MENHAKNIRILSEEPFWQEVLNNHFFLYKNNANFDLLHWDNGLKFQWRCETKLKIAKGKRIFVLKPYMRSLTGLWHAVSISILGWKLRATYSFARLPYFFVTFTSIIIKYIYLIKIAVALWQECNSGLISIHLVILAFLKLESLLITIKIIRLTKWIMRMAAEKKKRNKPGKRLERLNSVSEWKKTIVCPYLRI